MPLHSQGSRDLIMYLYLVRDTWQTCFYFDSSSYLMVHAHAYTHVSLPQCLPSVKDEVFYQQNGINLLMTWIPWTLLPTQTLQGDSTFHPLHIYTYTQCTCIPTTAHIHVYIHVHSECTCIRASQWWCSWSYKRQECTFYTCIIHIPSTSIHACAIMYRTCI